MKNRILAHLAAATIAAFLAQALPGAQPPASAGAIHGTVTDPSGAVIPEVSVSLSAHDLVWTISTDQRGHYALSGLPPGLYRVEVHFPGFSRFVKSGLVVSDGYETEADVQLTLSAVKQKITVAGE